jgi:hypothetical protein
MNQERLKGLDLDLIEAVLSTQAMPDEQSYYDTWQASFPASVDLATLAFAGGVLADRMAWVFSAGYQVAMRRVFSIRANRWAAFCASEGAQGRPGVTIDTSSLGEHRLYGAKTWVAAASVIDDLIVMVGKADAASFYQVPSTRPGLTIEIPAKDEFLSEMSKGVALFDGLVLVDGDRLEAPMIKSFPLYEAGSILLAFTGLLYRHGLSEGLAVANTYAVDLMQVEISKSLAALNSFLAELEMIMLEHADVVADIEGWVTDYKLVKMYSRLIKRNGR